MKKKSIRNIIKDLTNSEKINMTVEQFEKYLPLKSLSADNEKDIYIPVYIRFTSQEGFMDEKGNSNCQIAIDSESADYQNLEKGKLKFIVNPFVPLARGLLRLDQIQSLISLSSVELIEADVEYKTMNEKQDVKDEQN